jgi:hypothetical protein
MVREEVEWRAQDCAVAWIDVRPKYLAICDWTSTESKVSDIDRDTGWFVPRPSSPCKRIWRFSLLGGGQLKLTEHWVNDPSPLWRTWNRRTDVAIAAHVEDQLVRAHGRLEHVCGEMRTDAVVLRGNTQELADRAAHTLQLLTAADQNDECTSPDPERFAALLAAGQRCACCNRPLRDEVSKLLCIGPDCAAKLNIAHNTKAANRRLELRRQLLGTHA